MIGPLVWLNREFAVQTIKLDDRSWRHYYNYSGCYIPSMQRGYVKLWRKTEEGMSVVDRALTQKNARRMMKRIKNQ